MYHCIDVSPLKINFLLTDIVEPVVRSVAGSSIFAETLKGKVLLFLFVYWFGIYVFAFAVAH